MPFGATAVIGKKKNQDIGEVVNTRFNKYPVMILQLLYHFKTILMDHRWLEVVVHRFYLSVSYYTDCTVILIGLSPHVQRPANPHTSHIHVGLYSRIHTTLPVNHHCSHSHTDLWSTHWHNVNKRAAVTLVLVVVGLTVTRVRPGPAKCCLITTSSEEVTVCGVCLGMVGDN